MATALRRRGLITGAELALLAAATTRSGVGAPHGPGPYVPIFDGTRDSLAKWQQAPAGSFALRDDGSIRSVGGLGAVVPAPQSRRSNQVAYRMTCGSGAGG